MPILNWSYPGHAPATAQQLLANQGPRVQVEATVHPAVQKILADANLPIPQPISGSALIDTGASVSALDLVTASQLGLICIGRKPLLTPAGESEANQYCFALRLLPWGLNLTCVAGLGADLKRQGLVALIGMDLLCHCCLTLNGPGGFFFLAY
jgi:hypothetical protein